MKYTPFKKDISKLEAKDLGVLKNVSEGWYVEYKRQLPNTDKIAKSVTSFANTYGGWLFYGIDEEADGTRAAEFCGIDSPDKAEVHVREAVVYHSNPEPYFETNIIYGPCEDIGLPEGKAILIVYIPQSNSLPHVHGSGRIFRRVSDSSEPLVEKDRARLDAMWEQKRNSHDRLKTFLETAPPCSSNSDLTVLHVFLMSDPLGTKGHQSPMCFDTFSSIMGEADLPFDNIYTGSNSYIARQAANNDINQLLLTWQYFASGASVISIPVSAIQLVEHNMESAPNFFHGYKFGNDFLRFCDDKGKSNGWIIDLNQLCILLMSILGKHEKLLLRDDIQAFPYIKVSMENIYNKIPFIDSETYIDFLSKYGIPMPLHNKCYWPEGNDVNIFHIHRKDMGLEGKPKEFADAIVMFTGMMSCFGLPVRALLYEGEDVKAGSLRMITEFLDMNNRSPRSK